MRRFSALAGAVLLTATACMGGGGGNERTILVDFSHDEFASFYLLNFPKRIAVHPGTTLVFRQTWTGEPHTVTGGRMVDDALGNAGPLLDFIDAFEAMEGAGVGLPDPERPPPGMSFTEFWAVVETADAELQDQFTRAWDALAEATEVPSRAEAEGQSFEAVSQTMMGIFEGLFGSLPWAFDEGEELEIAQNVGQPCYLEEGGPPEDPQEPCSPEDQRQPDFDGSHSYYNSGMIPYEGPQGNEFRVQLSDDIEPGNYMFYCAVHGPIQSTDVEVRPSDREVPSAQEVAQQSREEIREVSVPLEQGYQEATQRGRVTFGSGESSRVLEGPFAGIYDDSYGHTAINEFIPRRMEVRAGEPITWKMMGLHTISFQVPEYFPVMEFLDDGNVRFNPLLQPPAGGAPEIPEPDEESEEIPQIDGGTYDGREFWSTGLIETWPAPYLEYTLRITEPGTYRYACLIHPPMVGTVVVR